jgi:hypothetical protein
VTHAQPMDNQPKSRRYPYQSGLVASSRPCYAGQTKGAVDAAPSERRSTLACGERADRSYTTTVSLARGSL